MLVSSSPKTKNQKRKTAVVLASGGLDSCVAAAVARREFDLALFHANYGQRSLDRELEAFRAQAAFFQAAATLEVDLNYLGVIGGSSLTDLDQAVPTDEVEPPGIPSTYVPFRNSNLLAAVVAWAEVLGAEAVFIGANVLDNPGYPDCRPEYFEAFNRVIELGTRPETHIPHPHPPDPPGQGRHRAPGPGPGRAPLNSPGRATRSELRACGRCSSCRLRLKGFAAAGVPDPIPYQPCARRTPGAISMTPLPTSLLELLYLPPVINSSFARLNRTPSLAALPESIKNSARLTGGSGWEIPFLW